MKNLRRCTKSPAWTRRQVREELLSALQPEPLPDYLDQISPEVEARGHMENRTALCPQWLIRTSIHTPMGDRYHSKVKY